MNPFTLFTLSGPALGAAGYYIDLAWLFWFGVALAAINLALNLASGAMKLPVLPVIAVAVGAALWQPWTIGAALGLLAYTLFEGLSELTSQG